MRWRVSSAMNNLSNCRTGAARSGEGPSGNSGLPHRASDRLGRPAARAASNDRSLTRFSLSAIERRTARRNATGAETRTRTRTLYSACFLPNCQCHALTANVDGVKASWRIAVHARIQARWDGDSALIPASFEAMMRARVHVCWDQDRSSAMWCVRPSSGIPGWARLLRVTLLGPYSG